MSQELNYKVGQVVLVDFIFNHPNRNPHVIRLSQIERVIVSMYDNGTLLLANIFDGKIEETSSSKYRVSCCIDPITYSTSITLLNKFIENIVKDNYYIAIDKMFGF